MIRDVLLYPDRCLETPCDPVEEFDHSSLYQILADLFETMYYYEGVGLAAPQIGVMRRVAVIDLSAGRDPGKRIVLVNPSVTRAQGTQCGQEGCLSFPDFVEQVTRSMQVTVDAMDATGTAVSLQCSGLLSRALQHEIDHLDGIVFLRRMSLLRRELLQRKIKKMLHAGDWGVVRRSRSNRQGSHSIT